MMDSRPYLKESVRVGSVRQFPVVKDFSPESCASFDTDSIETIDQYRLAPSGFLL